VKVRAPFTFPKLGRVRADSADERLGEQRHERERATDPAGIAIRVEVFRAETFDLRRVHRPIRARQAAQRGAIEAAFERRHERVPPCPASLERAASFDRA
jgi:hypothetical protein